MATYSWEPLVADDGLTPSNATFVQPWSSPSFSSTLVALDGSTPYVAFKPSATTLTNALAAFDEINSVNVSSLLVSEVYAELWPVGASNSWFVFVAATGPGFANANGYSVGINRSTGDFELRKVSGGTRTLLASTAGAGNSLYNVLFKITESGADVILQAKIWLNGGAEPGTWTLEHTDTSPLATLTGQVGVGQTNRATSFDPRLYYIGIATGGDSAPRPGGVTPVSFSGMVPTQNLTQDSAMTPLDLSTYFDGTETPFSYAVQTGTLPAGLSLGSSTGEITGTPTEAGTFPIVVRGTDDATNTADTNEFDIVVASAVATVTVTEPLKNNTGTLHASETGITASVLDATTLASVYEATGLTTNASGVLEAISSAAITASSSYHVVIKLPDGSVGITGPIAAT